jgi:cytochrome b561
MEIPGFHKSFGLTVLVLSLLRVAWRLVNPAPPLPQSMSRGSSFSRMHRDLNTSHPVLALTALVLIPVHISGAFYHCGTPYNVFYRMVPWAGTPRLK